MNSLTDGHAVLIFFDAKVAHGDAMTKQKERQFAVAVSFPGEHRRFVRNVVKRLAEKLGKERVFFDEWYESMLVGKGSDLKLKRIYRNKSDLVIPFFSVYYEKPWCGIEWDSIRSLLFERRNEDAVIPVELDDTSIEGWEPVDISIRKRNRSGSQIGDLIYNAYIERFPKGSQSVQARNRLKSAKDFVELCHRCIRRLERGLQWNDYTCEIENLLPEFVPLCASLGIAYPPLVLVERRRDGLRTGYLYWPFKTALGGRRESAILILPNNFSAENRDSVRSLSFRQINDCFNEWIRAIEHHISNASV